ncbi:MAG: hypothetical protein Q8P80_05030 [Candidatus Levybacteria bacterium]|nr:hypothetical protein [Candidatus Levybacteria bacterium]
MPEKTRRDFDRDSKEPLLHLGQKFKPFSLPQDSWNGYSYHLSINPGKYSAMWLHSEELPDLRFFTIIESDSPEKRNEPWNIRFEADKEHLEKIGLIKKKGFGSAVYGVSDIELSHFFYPNILEKIKRLKTTVWVPEGEYMATPNPYALEDGELIFDTFVKVNDQNDSELQKISSKPNDKEYLNSIEAMFAISELKILQSDSRDTGIEEAIRQASGFRKSISSAPYFNVQNNLLKGKEEKPQEAEDEMREKETKVAIIHLNEEFPLFGLPEKEIFFGPDYIIALGQASEIELETDVLPNLIFKIITKDFYDFKAGKIFKDIQQLDIESDIRQAIDLGIVHKSGRRSGAFPSHQPYGFNQNILPLIQGFRLELTFGEESIIVMPFEEDLCREGKLHFGPLKVSIDEKEKRAAKARFLLGNKLENGCIELDTEQGKRRYVRKDRQLYGCDEKGKPISFVCTFPPKSKPGRSKPFRF